MRSWRIASAALILPRIAGQLVQLEAKGGSSFSLRSRKTRGAQSLLSAQLLPEPSDISSLFQQAPLEEVPPRQGSWFSRLGNAWFRTLLGLILIPVALALMWLNEHRSAGQESIRLLGEAEVLSVSSKSMDSELHGQLVLLNDSNACGQDDMTDDRFPMVSGKGLRLRSTVEVYQWEEKQHSDLHDTAGTVSSKTKYSYKKTWSRFQIDSGHFNEPNCHRNNICIPGLKAGEESLNNSTVRYGDEDSSYYLPSELVSQLSKWTDASGMAKGPVKFDSYTFEKSSSEWFYYPVRSVPEVGDVRVCFEYVPDGPVSVMALQCSDKARREAASFLPYRLVNRGLCGSLSGDDLKEALLAQGRKTTYEEDACRTGAFSYLCCCPTNLITSAFDGATPAQIFAVWPGHLSHERCFWELELKELIQKWGLRFLSWLLLYAAVYMLFEPLIVILDIIPFLGKYVSSGTSWVLGITIFLITAIMATAVISLAYLVYHPSMALICFSGVGLLLGTLLGISKVL